MKMVILEISEMSYNDLIQDVLPLAQDEDSEDEDVRTEFEYWMKILIQPTGTS